MTTAILIPKLHPTIKLRLPFEFAIGVAFAVSENDVEYGENRAVTTETDL
jgi:hypothetical protein